jgi:hypothetical protein
MLIYIVGDKVNQRNLRVLAMGYDNTAILSEYSLLVMIRQPELPP